MKKDLKFLQINIGHRIVAHDALMAWLWRQEEDCILCIQEPYFSKKGLPRIPMSYGAYWADAQEGKTRRAMVIAPRKLNGYMITQRSNEDCVIVRFDALSISVVSAYFASDVNMEISMDRIVKEKDVNKNVLCCVDTNAYHAMWGSDLQINTGWAGRVRGIDLAYALDIHDFYVCNEVPHAPTFMRDNMNDFSHIDVTFSSRNTSNRINKWRVTDETFGSDHVSIEFIYSIEGEGRQEGNKQVGILWKKPGEKMQKVLKETIERVFSQHRGKFRNFNTIEEDINKHAGKVVEVLERTYKAGKNKGRKEVYWWTLEVVAAHKNLKLARRRMRKYGYSDLKYVFNKQRWLFRQAVNKAKLDAWRKFTTEMTDPWDKLIKIVRTTMSGRIQSRTLCTLDGEYASDMHVNLCNLGKQFFPRAEELLDCHRSVERRVEAELQAVEIGPKITTCEFRKALAEMKRATAPGLDKITNNVLVMLAQEGRQEKEYITLFNVCLKNWYFPTTWKLAKIVLIPKPATNPNTCKSFRPISLTSVLGKLFERIMLARLSHYLSLTNSLVPNQHAYMVGKSTQTALHELFSVVQYALYRRKMCVVVFLDISGAFDCTWHLGILSKLLDYGVPKYMVLWLKSFLCNRKALFMDGGVQHEVNLEQGCPQGGVISPVLWNILFNDLLALPVERGQKRSDCMKVIGYADDAAIVCKADTMEEINVMINAQLEKIKVWAVQHRIKFNPSKLAALTICNKAQLPGPSQIYYDGVKVQQVESYKYLGLLVDTRLSWSPHIDYVVNKLAIITRSLRGLSKEAWGVSLDIYRMLFKSIFMPVLTYGISIWGWKATSKKVAMKFDREIRKFALLATRCQKTTASTYLFSLLKTQTFANILQHEVLKVSVQQLHVTHTDRQSVYDNYARHRTTRVVPQCMDQQHYMYRQEMQRFISNIKFDNNKDHLSVHPCKWVSTNVVVRDFVSAIWEGADMRGWVIFTDASSSSYGVGWSCIAYHHGICKTIRNGALSNCSIYKAEAYAVYQAVCYANSIDGLGENETIEIRSDALGVAQSLMKYVHYDKTMFQIKDELRKAHQEGKNIVIKWVPSHQDVFGNEQADLHAKIGVDSESVTKIDVTGKELDARLRKERKSAFDKRWNNFDSRNVKLFLPDPMALDKFLRSSPTVALCQLVSGHTRLNEFVYRVLGLRSSPLCACNKGSETISHFLFECEQYKQLRLDTWGDVEHDYGVITSDWRKLANFVKDTKRFQGRCVAYTCRGGGGEMATICA